MVEEVCEKNWGKIDEEGETKESVPNEEKQAEKWEGLLAKGLLEGRKEMSVTWTVNYNC